MLGCITTDSEISNCDNKRVCVEKHNIMTTCEIAIEEKTSSLDPHEDSDSNTTLSQTSQWKLFGDDIAKSQVVFMCQYIVIILVVVTSLINLTRETNLDQVWCTLLSGAIGYLLPAPSIRRNNRKQN